MIGGFIAKRLTTSLSKRTMSAAQKQALAKAIKASADARRKNFVGRVVDNQRKKNLAALSKKIATNKASIKKVSGKDTVFRLQRPSGAGFARKGVVPPKRIGSSKNKPFPVSSQKELESLRKLYPDYDWEYLNFNRSQTFGFKDLKQANRYFTKEEQSWYKRKGYNITKLDGVTIQAQSKNQLTFTQDASLNKLRREREALAKKYERLAKKLNT